MQEVRFVSPRLALNVNETSRSLHNTFNYANENEFFLPARDCAVLKSLPRTKPIERLNIPMRAETIYNFMGRNQWLARHYHVLPRPTDLLRDFLRIIFVVNNCNRGDLLFGFTVRLGRKVSAHKIRD